MKKTRPMDDRVWMRVYREDARRRQKGRCIFCLYLLSSSETTGDHIRPRSRGGAVRPRNIQAACQLCNSLKGRMANKKFMSVMSGRAEASFHVKQQRAIRRIHVAADQACVRIRASVGLR